jgi:hypothetical protein
MWCSPMPARWGSKASCRSGSDRAIAQAARPIGSSSRTQLRQPSGARRRKTGAGQGDDGTAARPPCRRSPDAGSVRLDGKELGPATSAKWKFVLGHLQPVLGEHEPVSFLTLRGAVLGLLNTGIGVGAELFSFRSRRGHVRIVIPISPPSIAKLGECQLFLATVIGTGAGRR